MVLSVLICSVPDNVHCHRRVSGIQHVEERIATNSIIVIIASFRALLCWNIDELSAILHMEIIHVEVRWSICTCVAGSNLQIPLQTDLVVGVCLPFILRSSAIEVEGSPIGRFIRVAILGPNVHHLQRK